MSAEITMPQLSDTMTEGTVVKWLKKEGEKVKEGEIVAEVETDKATMEYESPEAGTLAAQVAEGSKVPVGQPIAVLAGAGDDVNQIRQQFKSASAGGAAKPATTKPPQKAAEVQQDKETDHHKMSEERESARDEQQGGLKVVDAPSETGRVKV